MKALIVLLSTGAALLAQTPPPAKSAAPAAKSAAPATKTAAAPVSNPLLHPENLKAKAPDDFKVKFTTTHGDFVVQVHRNWSPLGADRFYNLVKNRYFTNVSFFRFVPGFIVQFGMAPDPKIGAVWENATVKDDPMLPTVHNTKGTLVFATSGPNTRTTQLFVNLNDNTRSLDSQHFSPFGEVIEGYDIASTVYSGYGESPQQGKITAEGKAYLDKNFPRMDSIKSAVIMPADGAAAPAAMKSTAPMKSTAAAKSTAAPAVKK